MSEEAKKTIDLLKFYEGFFKNIGHEEEVKSIESVINYIEKLKKENEELRQNYDIATTKTEELKKKLGLKQFDVNVVYNDYLEKLREFKSNSIPKYKIREKIKELEDEAEICRKEGCENTESFDICCAEILKELLGEE